MAAATTIKWLLAEGGSFDQDLSAWNITAVTNGIDFLRSGALSTANYDALLIAWGAQVVQSSVQINFGDSKYTAGGAAAAARAHLVGAHSWSISDGGTA
jgi:hypothetical protein